MVTGAAGGAAASFSGGAVGVSFAGNIEISRFNVQNFTVRFDDRPVGFFMRDRYATHFHLSEGL